jgi:membrane fusion protein (multidrug efflux system)
MTANATKVEPEVPNRKRTRYLWLFTIILVLIGIALFCYWFFYAEFHESTDDANANGSLITVNSAINGSVIAFYADDTDLVKEGQLLIELDPTYYQVGYDKALAALSAEVLEVKQIYNTVLVNQADVEVKRISLSKTQYDYNNRASLVNSKAISNEDFIHSRDDLTIAEFELKKAESQLLVSQDAAGNTPMSEHPRIKEKIEAVIEAFYYLKHTKIYAPTTGYVAQRSVNVGQTLSQTRSAMSIIPIDYVWVDANFKETQLKYMRIGQPASVWLDIYGSSVKYEGKVLGIASGSGSVFSLIPPQNATGNWIKIVQRLPVRISLDPETVKKYPLRLGLSANVDVDISNQDLPMLAQIAKTKPITTTDVFDISLNEVNKAIQERLELFK